MELKDKFVLITGASRGIGNAVAEKLAKKNCHLILVSRSFEEGTIEKFKKLGAPSVYLIESDLSLESGCEKVLDYIEKQNLNIDVLFNNAGQLTGGLLEKQSMPDIRKMLRVNVEALIELTHGLLPKMLQRKQGLIVNNSSVSGKMFFPCASTYAASKAAVVAFTESMSQELAGTGVKTLLLITPGIKTKMYDDIYKLYGENLDLKFLNHISAEEWAEKIVEAMELDKQTLWPSGSNAIGVLVGHHMPGLFARVVRNSFKR
jgi:short-subunit dehydrogenase